MKKIIVLIFVFFAMALQSFAVDVMPDTVSFIRTNTLGVYQVSSPITLYSQPDVNSEIKTVIKYTKDTLEPLNLVFQDVFIVYKGDKGLALMAVTDENEDWVEVIYDNKLGLTGWIKKDDPYKFLTWVNFYNMYSKKYGLYILNGAPESVLEMHGSPDDTSKVISTINQPQKIILNLIKGNWMLVSVMDIDMTPKTGYIRWRSDEGIKYLFPAIK